MKAALFFTSLLALGSSTVKDTTYLRETNEWVDSNDIETWFNVNYPLKGGADASSCDLSVCHDGARAKAYQLSPPNDANGQPVTQEYKLCMCENPDMEEAAAILRISLIPHFMRKYTKTYIVASVGYNGPTGSTEKGDTMILKEPMRGGEFIRAATRNYDIQNKISQSAEWRKAVASDKCVYDPYSNENQENNFANMGLVYMRTYAEENTIECMKNQLAFFTKLVPTTEKFDTKLFAKVESKPLLLPNRERWVGEESLEKYYLSTPYKTSPGGDSSNCLVHECGRGAPQIFTVSYEDGTSHKFCVCGDPIVTLESAATKWGIVPKFIREHTDTFTIGSKGSHTYAAYAMVETKQIVMLGDYPSGTYVHEAAHTYDANVRKGTTLSETAEWINAENNDSCIPVIYGKTNPTEDFAEVAVVRMLLPFLKVDSSCMKNQLEQFEKFIPSGESKTGTLKPEFKGKFLAK